MNRTDLLNDLASKPFIRSLVGDPLLINIKPNGDKWYQQNVLEVSSNGTHAAYVNIDFYVINEGLSGEAAFYKDSDPSPTVQWTAFADAVGYQILTQHIAPNGDSALVDFSFIFVDETWKAGIIKGLVIDPADPEGKKLIPQGFYIAWDENQNLIMIQMDLDASIIAQSNGFA